MNKKKRILVVEDEELLLRALSDKLKREGFEVLEASNGKDGLEIALTEQPNLILLDMVMPVMDGITMLKALRNYDAGKIIPVIVLTNLTDADIEEEAVGRKVADYLVKADWRISDVVKKIREKLEG